MEHLKINTLANQPNPGIDLTRLLEVITCVIGFVAGWWKYLDNKFRQDKLDKRQFIEDVVEATMNSCLGELKSDFNEFKKHTSDKIDEFNRMVIKIYGEIKR